jgi:hypothetical protein
VLKSIQEGVVSNALEINTDLMDPPPPPSVEGYLAATQLTALESTVATLQRENEDLVEKCRILGLEKNK